jgi:serine/threonine protein kinase
MSDPGKPRTPPPAPPDGTTPVIRGLQEEVSTNSSLHGETPTIAGHVAFGMTGSLVGQVFGDFELLAELGRGGMGIVYKAWQKSLERPVAVKLLLAEHSSNPQLLARFLAEARAAASLTHPNIVSVYQVGECIAGPYFVMEFIDGPSLESLLQRTVPIPWSVALLTTVADAVQHAHEKGIIHRDLKPANIMLQGSKRPVVMDFGIAKVLGKGSRMTEPGALVGTPSYMPPEQAGEQPEKIGPHSDVYALGAILYNLLAGKPPFEESSALRTVFRVLSPDPPEPIRLFRPEVPARLEQVCMKCLEKEPSRRYPSAQALADELKRVRAMLASSASGSFVNSGLPTLVLVNESGKQIRLLSPTTVIGRASECDMVIKASDVSKRHCRIVLTPDQAVVEDLGSSNGTFVNGDQIERARLTDGDELDIGGHLYKVRLQKGGSKEHGSIRPH